MIPLLQYLKFLVFEEWSFDFAYAEAVSETISGYDR